MKNKDLKIDGIWNLGCNFLRKRPNNSLPSSGLNERQENKPQIGEINHSGEG